MSIRAIAQQGLDEGSRLRWKFWKRGELNDQAMDQALVAIGREAEPRLAGVAEFARKLAESSPNRTQVYRTALEPLAAQLTGDLAPMAGLALAVLRASEAEPSVKETLGKELLPKLDGGAVAGFAAKPEAVLGLLHEPPSDLGKALEPLLDAANSGQALELLRPVAPDWVALHEKLPLSGEQALIAERRMLASSGAGPAPAAASWASELSMNGLDLAAWGLEQNRVNGSGWHQWYDEWAHRHPLTFLQGSLTGQAPTAAMRTSLTRAELATGEPSKLLDWLNRTAPSPSAELARALLDVPLADASARTGLLQTALDGGELSDQVHTLRDKLRLLYGGLALAEGPFEGVREGLAGRPWREQATSLWIALHHLGALPPDASPVQRARAVASAAPGLDEVLWRNLGKTQPLLAEWATREHPDRSKAWDELEELCGSLGFQVTTTDNQALVREEQGFVDIGPVRLAKRDQERAGAVVVDSAVASHAGAPSVSRAQRFLTAALDPALDACPADELRGSVGQALMRQAVDAALRLEGGYSSRTRSMYTIAAAVAGDGIQAAYDEALAAEGGYSSKTRSVYTLAAAQAGSPEKSQEAFQLALEMEGGYSTESRAHFAVAAAIAGSPEAAREAARVATELEGGYSTRTRATFAQAAAIAGPDASLAHAKAASLEGGYSSKTRGVYFIACAIAGSRADAAHAEALQNEGGYSSKTRALHFVAAAVAGSPETSRQAFQLALEAEGGYSSETRAYYAIAAAAALNPANRHLAAAIFYPEEKK
jgi:hypothetical protein